MNSPQLVAVEQGCAGLCQGPESIPSDHLSALREQWRPMAQRCAGATQIWGCHDRPSGILRREDDSHVSYV